MNSSTKISTVQKAAVKLYVPTKLNSAGQSEGKVRFYPYIEGTEE